MPQPARRPSRTDTRLTADLDIPGAFEGETITRRRLVTTGANVAGALAAAAIVVPALGFALGPSGRRAKVTWQAIGPPDAFPKDTFVARIVRVLLSAASWKTHSLRTCPDALSGVHEERGQLT